LAKGERGAERAADGVLGSRENLRQPEHLVQFWTGFTVLQNKKLRDKGEKEEDIHQ
jgi:hypothetical protein